MIVTERTLRRLGASTRFGDVRQLAEVDSTNRWLLERARAGAPEGLVVVADYQTAGRGRLGRSWEAPSGRALLTSILLRPNLAPDRRWLVSAAVALSGADTCGPGASIKWPNDILLDDAKVAGILAESDAGAVVVGIGMNVSWAPPGAAALGSEFDRGELLATLLVHLEAWCDRWHAVESEYQSRCATVGRSVRVELGDGTTIAGRAEGIESNGALRIVAGGSVHILTAADVIHLRPAGNVTGQ